MFLTTTLNQRMLDPYSLEYLIKEIPSTTTYDLSSGSATYIYVLLMRTNASNKWSLHQHYLSLFKAISNLKKMKHIFFYMATKLKNCYIIIVIKLFWPESYLIHCILKLMLIMSFNVIECGEHSGLKPSRVEIQSHSVGFQC